MSSRNKKRSSLGSNRVLPIVPGQALPLTANLPPELKAISPEQLIRQLSLLTTHDSFSSLSSLRRLSAPQIDSWREEFRREGVFKRAFWAMAMMLRNAAVSISCAVLLNYLCSVGTLSHKPPREQSYTLFFLAIVYWSHFFVCVAVFMGQACFLLSLRFSVRPDEPATFFFCLKRLYTKTYICYFVSLVGVLGTTYGVIVLVPPELRKFKLEYYLSCFSAHIYLTNAIVSTRRIFQQETIAGLKHSNRDASDAHRLVDRISYFAKVYARYSILLLVIAAAGAFVHGIHHFHIAVYTDVWVGVGGCTALKYLIQEATKMYVFSKKMNDIRIMWLAIAIPTVVIDTQLRMVLQRPETTELMLTGLGVMAVVEVSMRAIKVLLVKLEIRRSEASSYPTTVSAAIRQFRQEQAQGERRVYVNRRGSNASMIRFERWKQRVLSFHTAEMYASMTAQYIAIGCSTSLLVFYWTHAKYELHLVYDHAKSGQKAQQHEAASQWSLFTVLAAELAAEVAVDYLSSLLEIGVGIDFDELRRYGPFVVAMLMCMAVLNVQISAIIYLRID